MKIIAFNGSPKKKGNTYHLIRHTLNKIEKTGIKTELVQIGGTKVHPCMACGKCFETLDRECSVKNDRVNEYIGKMIDADAIIIGTPTYFAGVTPEIKAFMDRAFFVGKANGAVCAVDTINHYFGISGMFTAGSRYWNNAKGLQPGDVDEDEKGIDTMKQLGENIVWFIKKIHK